MIRPEDLLSQAEHLAWLDAAYPAEVNLRRAISAAYYALFHALTEVGASLSGTTSVELQNQIRRAYNHGTMRSVCEVYSRARTRPFPSPHDLLLRAPIDPRIHDIAAVFLELQEARNQADYDLLSTVSVRDTDHLITVARRAVRDLRVIESLPETSVFLTALLLADRWTRRG